MLAAQSVSNQNKIQQIVAIIGGYMQAEEDLIVQRQSNIMVLPSQRFSTQIKKEGVENMRKYCYKRKDGRWEYSKMENGMLYYAIANTYRELIVRIPKIRPKQKRTVKSVKKIGKTTVIEYCQFFYDNYISGKAVTNKTKQEWQATINNYIKPYFPRMELEKCSTEVLQKFINGITRETTRGKVFNKIKRIFSKAYLTGKLKFDITAGLEKPKQKFKQVRSPLTLAEQIAFLEKAKHSKIYAFAMFSIIVGSRREETLKFNLDHDIDYQTMKIHIHGTKTENAERNVYVTKAFVEFLKAHMEKPTFNMSPRYAWEKVKDIFNELQMDKTLHELRHTCSANLYFLGAPDKYRQLQLGHASIVITNDIYTNIKENIPKAKLRELYGDLYPNFDDNFDDKNITK